MECAVAPLKDVPELLEKIQLSPDLKAEIKSPTRNLKSSAFGGFKKGFLANTASKKEQGIRVDSTKASLHSKGCSKSLSLESPDSVKSIPEPSKPLSTETTLKAPKPSEIIEETTKLPLLSEKSVSNFTPETTDLPTVSLNTSEVGSWKKKSSSKLECVPNIDAQCGVKSLLIPEVQEALKSNPSTAFESVAQARLTPSTSVNDILEDPSWLAILAEFQEDPEAAMVKYKDDREVRTVMTQLCTALGDNFLNLSASTKKSEDESLVERVMGESRVRAAMQSPAVQRIMELAKAGRNDVVRRLMAEASDEDRQHIRTLLDFGLFSFSC